MLSASLVSTFGISEKLFDVKHLQVELQLLLSDCSYHLVGKTFGLIEAQEPSESVASPLSKKVLHVLRQIQSQDGDFLQSLQILLAYCFDLGSCGALDCRVKGVKLLGTIQTLFILTQFFTGRSITCSNSGLAHATFLANFLKGVELTIIKAIIHQDGGSFFFGKCKECFTQGFIEYFSTFIINHLVRIKKIAPKISTAYSQIKIFITFLENMSLAHISLFHKPAGLLQVFDSLVVLFISEFHTVLAQPCRFENLSAGIGNQREPKRQLLHTNPHSFQTLFQDYYLPVVFCV